MAFDPQTHRIDFDAVARLAQQHKPKMIVAGASALSPRNSTRALRADCQ